MCGIAGGIWTRPELAIEPDTLARMTTAIRHRGPDDQGLYQESYRLRPPYEAQPGIALGHRRLSIIDVACGHQPLANENDTVWTVFNGEIYNFADLRRRLEGSGHRFRTNSDTETIVHLYEDEGPACFEHMAGMFSIAIWDSVRRRLVLGRDRLGKKPLVYRAEPGRLIFASELKSLLQVPGVPRDIDHSAIDEYLTYQYVPHPNTIFKGFKKLTPGHFLVWQDDEVTIKPYWQPDFSCEQLTTERQAVERVRELLTDAVKTRLQSEVPLGAFLSGGVDSSLIVALMQQQSSTPVKTFTIGFPEKEYDESAYAERVAKHLGTEHQTLRVDPDAVKILPKLAFHYDEPFADSSAVPTWYVSQLTREHVTVALSGDGGDELFAGYSRYRAVSLGGWFDRWPMFRSLFGAGLWQLLPASGRQKSKVRQFKRFSSSLNLPAERRYLDWISIFNEGRRGELYNEDFVSHLPNCDPAGFLLSAWKRTKGRDPISAASLTDLVTYLPCDLMTKVDIASMAHGLEVRAPFLDHRLVEFAATLPVKFKYRKRRGKYLLQKAFGHLLPREVWQRPKMGFGVPLDHWFRNELNPLLRESLLDGQCVQRWFRREAVEELIKAHEARTFDHSARLWALLMLELWLKEWGQGAPRESDAVPQSVAMK
ncbi:asparagine synthase (glutamine-hydrolyzing) [Anatilimnocola floriformis]|uniref:asparagine synthase (glutamine-hydrolyzing) n=1 Tax=Anatilimnocola floriformis TaxID=2948575 RepID=UPI0020C2E266|nr:asparagine synthase (glutamine-hydrolyzing) [Anatilimnocola floriformis]